MKLSINKEGEIIELEDMLPVIPLRDVVIYPNMVVPLLVGREASVAALELSMLGDKLLFLAPQLESDISEPEPADLYDIGTISRILQIGKTPEWDSESSCRGGSNGQSRLPTRRRRSI